ncbi:hypothetical protein DV737_g3752, partial [Chaetothyriales sp. CBS 132003]
MNYPNMTTTGLQSAISLPPISSIDFRQPEYVQQRPIYHGIPSVSSYPLGSSRVPLASTNDPGLVVAPARHKTKEVKRRTKTGCLTCRKRRIKCDEGKPECRNCQKSKRHCLGYDPVFQSQGPHSILPASNNSVSSAGTSSSSAASSVPTRRYTVSSNPSATVYGTSLNTTTRRDSLDYPYSKAPDLVPVLGPPYSKMDSTGPGSLTYPPPSSTRREPSHQQPLTTSARKTMEEICSVGGTKLPPVPAIPPDSVPNLEPIGKVYNMNFAPGLDKLLESDKHWFASEGFKLVAGDRSMLGLVLAYLTLISNNADKAMGEDATLASQEARVTYGSLRQCVRLEHDGGREGEKLARRFRTIESILTGEPLAVPPASMSEFVDVDMDEQQLEPTVEQIKGLADGRENRDILYAILLLGWGKNGDPGSERELAKRFLQSEAQGRATELVFATIAGMGLRAFGES